MSQDNVNQYDDGQKMYHYMGIEMNIQTCLKKETEAGDLILKSKNRKLFIKDLKKEPWFDFNK